jgi:ribosomal protein S18 acetylase RimI-like enzyme
MVKINKTASVLLFFFWPILYQQPKKLTDMNNQILPAPHPFYDRYIRLGTALPVKAALIKYRDLSAQLDLPALESLQDRTYAPGKWTVRDILQHIIDTERILAYRALLFARRDDTPHAGFDERAYADHAMAVHRTLQELVEEFEAVRAASIWLFESFTPEMLALNGVARHHLITVEALGYTIVGHQHHHQQLIRERYYPLLNDQAIQIIGYETAYQPFFEQLNRAWIEAHFLLEPIDEQVLGHPEESLLKDGGQILFAACQGRIIGTVALRRTGPEQFELTKMAVDPSFHGLGAGKLLLESAISQATGLGAASLVLYSNTRFNSRAIGLYRRSGFREVPLESGTYARADIKMERQLGPV